MTARRAPLAELPDWPRLLNQAEAARYVGVSVGAFAELVEAGHYPRAAEKKTPSGEPALWDRLALDEAIDRRAGRRQPAHGDKLAGRAHQWGQSP